MLVRVERGLRIDRALGAVEGRIVTVEIGDPRPIAVGDRAVFFATNWVQGDEIAVHEVARRAASAAGPVATAVRRLPDIHLAERLAAADAVVDAHVTATRALDLPLERRAPWWAEATLDVVATLRGDAAGMRLFFPTHDSQHWYGAPRPAAGDRGVFALRRDDPEAEGWLEQVGTADAVTALDPADVQPESQLARVQKLLQGRVI
jgi:hypothetical protein